jgi:hypothetical protein
MAVKFNKVSGTLGEKEIASPAIRMGIESAPTKLIVKYITDTYTLPLDAAIRETVSNAVDAARAKGLGYEAVEVGFGNPAIIMHKATDTYIHVKDNGVGMDYDTLVNVYTQYGMSDKRDTDEMTGAFGLGAKSPLAYTSEFHVITQTAAGAYHLVCYRTDDEDFLCEVTELTKNVQKITKNRNPVTDRIVAPGDTETKSVKRAMTVKNPFADGETGTYVCFALKNTEDAYSAASILWDLEALMNEYDGVSIVDMESVRAAVPYNHRAGRAIDVEGCAFEVGRYAIEDASGEKITVKVSLNSVQASATMAANALFNLPKNRLSLANIGVKVANWYYPSVSSVWRHRDDFPASTMSPIVIEIPSKGLQFVPSRDSIIDNGNLQEIVSKLRDKLQTTFQDELLMGRIIEWCVERDNDTYLNVISNALGTVTSYDADAHVLEAGDRIKARASVEGVRISASSQIKVPELLGTPRVLAGFMVHRPKSKGYTAANGPLGIDENMASDACSLLFGKHGNASWKTTKTKRAGDKLASDGTGHTFEGLSFDVPGGCAITSLMHELRSSSTKFAIVDASKERLGTVRAAMSRIALSYDEGYRCGTFFAYAIIPASENGEADGAKAAARIREIVSAYVPKDRIVDIDAQTLSGYLAKKPKAEELATKQLEDFRKMFSGADTVSVSPDAGRRSSSFYARRNYYEPFYVRHASANDKSASLAIAEQLIKHPEGYAIFIDADAVKYAKAAFALGLYGEDKKAICVAPNKVTSARADFIRENGFDVAVDSTKSILEEEQSVGKALRYEDGHMHYTGNYNLSAKNHNDNIQKFFAMRQSFVGYSARYMSFNIMNGWDEMSRKPATKEDIRRYNYALDRMCSVVESISYGSLKLDRELFQWASGEETWQERYIASDIILDNDENKADNDCIAGESTVSTAHGGEIYDQVYWTCRIWNQCLSNAGFEWKGQNSSPSKVEALISTGKVLGIDSIVNAFFCGVPYEDLFSELPASNW